MRDFSQERLIIGGNEDLEEDNLINNRRGSKIYDKPRGIKLVWNYFAQFIIFCGLGSIIYLIYVESVYLNKLITRDYVEADGSTRNYTRDEFDYHYPSIHTVWINLRSPRLSDTQKSNLKKGKVVYLEESLDCHSLTYEYDPIVTISLNFNALYNGTNSTNTTSGNYTSQFDLYYSGSTSNSGSDGSSDSSSSNGNSANYDSYEKVLADYGQYAHYFYNSDYEQILHTFVAMNSNDSSLNGSNSTNGTSGHHNHTVDYSSSIYYLQNKEFGYLIVGMIVNTMFLIASYIMIYMQKDRYKDKKLCENVYTYQIHFKNVYFPKCHMNKFFASFVFTLLGITTPLYFIGSILPALAYNVETKNGGICLSINESLLSDFDIMDETLLENIFLFQFYWWLVISIIFILSYCLPEEHKRDTWQQGTLYILSIFMLAALVIGIVLSTSFQMEMLMAYLYVAATYVVTFILQLTMF